MRRRAGREELLYVLRKFYFFLGAPAPLPLGQKRPGGNDRAKRTALVRFRVEMPDAFVAEAVGVRIAREHVGRNVFGQTPLAPGFTGACQREVHCGQIAGMIPVARADEQ